MPFAPAFDLAVCFGALGHILPRDQDRFIEAVKRVLRPGGSFVFVTGERPPLWSPQYWLRRTFNATMHVRNWLVSPPFVMFYLTFLLPHARTLLGNHGFEVELPAVTFLAAVRRASAGGGPVQLSEPRVRTLRVCGKAAYRSKIRQIPASFRFLSKFAPGYCHVYGAGPNPSVTSG